MLVAIRIPGVDVHEVIQTHRRYLVELMQQWTRLKEDEAGSINLRWSSTPSCSGSTRWSVGSIRLTAASSVPSSINAPAPQPFPMPKVRRKVGVKR